MDSELKEILIYQKHILEKNTELIKSITDKLQNKINEAEELRAKNNKLQQLIIELLLKSS